MQIKVSERDKLYIIIRVDLPKLQGEGICPWTRKADIVSYPICTWTRGKASDFCGPGALEIS